MTKVSELMHRGLIMCAPDATLAEVAGLLRTHGIHGVLVRTDDGHAAGVVTDTDLLAGEWLGDTQTNLSILKKMTARELMSRPIESIDAGSEAREAAERMRNLHVARLLVTDGSQPVGVLSISDLLGALPRAPQDRRYVRDVMSWGYVACRPEAPVSSVVRAMLERDSRSVIVLDEDGRLVGVVTGFDLIRLLGGEHGGAAKVEHFMHPPITTTPDATIREAVDLMLTKAIHRLVVVDSGQPDRPPVGLISTTDIMVEMGSAGSAWQP